MSLSPQRGSICLRLQNVFVSNWKIFVSNCKMYLCVHWVMEHDDWLVEMLANFRWKSSLPNATNRMPDRVSKMYFCKCISQNVFIKMYFSKCRNVGKLSLEIISTKCNLQNARSCIKFFVKTQIKFLQFFQRYISWRMRHLLENGQ